MTCWNLCIVRHRVTSNARKPPSRVKVVAFVQQSSHQEAQLIISLNAFNIKNHIFRGAGQVPHAQ